MEALFKVRYWDYTKNKFNFQGHICLGTSLSWGFLTILMTEVVHVPVERMTLSIPDMTLKAVTGVLTVYIAADFALSFKAVHRPAGCAGEDGEGQGGDGPYPEAPGCGHRADRPGNGQLQGGTGRERQHRQGGMGREHGPCI